MQFSATPLAGVVIAVPDVREDARGFFMEIYRKDRFADARIDIDIVQVNQSRSKKGVVRGLHIQWNPPLGKLVRVLHGRAFFVAVDCRKDSKTLGKWTDVELSRENKTMIYVPPGFASGFCALTEEVDVEYQYTALYNPNGEGSIRWNDSDIGIDWPVDDPIISPRDSEAMSFADWVNHPTSHAS